MRHLLLLTLLVVVLSAGFAGAGEGLEGSGYQTPAAEQSYDMDGAEDRWVKIGSRFFLLLIVLLIVKKAYDKRNA